MQFDDVQLFQRIRYARHFVGEDRRRGLRGKNGRRVFQILVVFGVFVRQQRHFSKWSVQNRMQSLPAPIPVIHWFSQNFSAAFSEASRQTAAPSLITQMS
jgi:hypothetical protein